MSATSDDVDAYLASLPEPARQPVEQVRQALHAALPGSGEKRSYGIVGVTVDGKVVVWFGGYADHVGVYPVPGDADLEGELAPYRAGKGTLRFPLAEPMPLDLVRRVAVALDQARRSRQGGQA